MTNRQQVLTYCKQIGLKVNASQGIPLISNASLSFCECFDDWDDALRFIAKARSEHFDHGKEYPWNA